jgi:hypothetical protein
MHNLQDVAGMKLGLGMFGSWNHLSVSFHGNWTLVQIQVRDEFKHIEAIGDFMVFAINGQAHGLEVAPALSWRQEREKVDNFVMAATLG